MSSSERDTNRRICTSAVIANHRADHFEQIVFLIHLELMAHDGVVNVGRQYHLLLRIFPAWIEAMVNLVSGRFECV